MSARRNALPPVARRATPRSGAQSSSLTRSRLGWRWRWCRNPETGMAAVKAGEVEGTLKRLSPSVVAVLFYGPDAGLIAERAKATAARAVDDPSDPFQLIRLDGDVVAADPARLADEAGTIGLFGGKRAIWVKPSSRNLA